MFSETVNNSGYGKPTDNFSALGVLVRVRRSGCCFSQYTITGLRRVRAYGRGDARTHRAAAAVGMWTSVVVSVIFGWILLAGGDVRAPEHAVGIDLGLDVGYIVPSPGPSR